MGFYGGWSVKPQLGISNATLGLSLVDDEVKWMMR